MAKKTNVSTDAHVKFWWEDGTIHLRILAVGIPTQLTTLSGKTWTEAVASARVRTLCQDTARTRETCAAYLT